MNEDFVTRESGGPAASANNPAAVSANSAVAVPGAAMTISVPRDLAVQIVGPDAGRQSRMKPHGSMTKGATAEEIAAVEVFMKPFLDQEIDRVHNKTGRPAANHVGNATVTQAKALRGFCARFAESLKQHLVKKGADDRHYRSKQRMDQAWAVVNQINAALGLPLEDGKSKEEWADDIIGQAIRLQNQLQRFLDHCARTVPAVCAGGALPSPLPQLLAFAGPLNELVETTQQRQSDTDA